MFERIALLCSAALVGALVAAAPVHAERPTIVTWGGSIIVLRSTTNRTLRPGNWNRAKPYATAAADNVCETVLTIPRKTLLRVKSGKGSSFSRRT